MNPGRSPRGFPIPLTLLAIALVGGACASPSTGTPIVGDDDAGPVADAGGAPDGAQAPVDGGQPDAALGQDAGSAEPDAGVAVDAGQSEVPDSGTVVGSDAGPPDSDGGGSAGGCADAQDEAIFTQASEQTAISNCATNNVNYATVSLNEPAALDCIEATGLTTACATCVDAEANCTVSQCALSCISPSSSSCTTCRDSNCQPAFNTCSGL